MVFLSTKQIIYSEYGDPNKVNLLYVLNILRNNCNHFKVLQFETKDIREEKELDGKQVLVSWQASPINPADIGQIQGGLIGYMYNQNLFLMVSQFIPSNRHCPQLVAMKGSLL
jgi:hypothetical protein